MSSFPTYLMQVMVQNAELSTLQVWEKGDQYGPELLQAYSEEINFWPLNPPMAKGGGGWMPLPPTGFSNFSQKWEELSLQTKLLPLGSSLGHLSMKKFYWLIDPLQVYQNTN